MLVFLAILACILMMLTFLCASAQKWFNETNNTSNDVVERDDTPEFRTPTQTNTPLPETHQQRQRRLERQRQQSELRRQQQADQVDLVSSMTPDERRKYVANFLKTDIFASHDRNHDSSPRSGSFVLSQSMKKFASFSNTSLSTRSNLSDDAFQNCAICLEQFTNGEDICVSQNVECPHQFHLPCAFGWLLKSQECPCCRRDYLTVCSQKNTACVALARPTDVIGPTSAPRASPSRDTEDPSSHHGLTAEQILDRVSSELPPPPPPSIPPPRRATVAQALLAGEVPRTDDSIFQHQGLTARQMLEGAVPSDDYIDRRSYQLSDGMRIRNDVPALPRWETRDATRDVVVGLVPHGGHQLNPNERIPSNALTAREMLAGNVIRIEPPVLRDRGPVHEPIYQHQGLTARQILAGEGSTNFHDRPLHRPTAREALA